MNTDELILSEGLGRRSEAVMQRLRGEIKAGTWIPGDRLPTERELCQTLSISRPTVRRAMRRLADEGFVTIRQGSGAYVLPSSRVTSAASRTISAMFTFDSRLLKELHDKIHNLGFLASIYLREGGSWDPRTERKFLERVRAERHRGLLAFCTPLQPTNSDLLTQMAEEGIRIIHIEASGVEAPEQSFILPDYRKAGRLAAMHLFIAGYKRILFARVRRDSPAAELIDQGIADAIKDFNPGTEAGAIKMESLVKSDRTLFVETLRRLPASTGIVCSCIPMAEDVFGVLSAEQMRCPDDFGIVGVPNLDASGSDKPVDTVEFDRLAQMNDALQWLIRESPGELRRLITPRVMKRGTVR